MANGFPHGRRFAFTILDDTDDATVDNVRPVYDVLFALGFRTTKTVWANDCPKHLRGPYFAAQTLRDDAYRSFVHQLVDRGFELAFHGATMGSSLREDTASALEYLRSEFGSIPRIHCNHGQNRDNVYWGAERYRTTPINMAARLIARWGNAPPYEGAKEGSPFFWGDMCRAHFEYVRGLTFARLDTSELPPHGPYHDAGTPHVSRWFTTSDAPDVASFTRLVTRSAVDRLVQDGGVCILSTHLGKGYSRDGHLDARVQSILEYIAGLPGWFATTSEILDYQLKNTSGTITSWERLKLESAHVADRFRQRLPG